MLRKEVAELVRRARAHGWVVQKTRGGHLRWKSPDGKVVFSGSTPSDVRAVRNIRSSLRRMGLIAVAVLILSPMGEVVAAHGSDALEGVVQSAYAIPQGIEVRIVRCDDINAWVYEGSHTIHLCLPLPSDTALLAFILAHEVGHLVLGHSGWVTPPQALRQEIEADRYAARTAGPAAAAAGCRLFRAILAECSDWRVRVRMAALGCLPGRAWR
jgi:predicted RNA binding protein YcfA (HicA-like mRNA interferase family)